MPASQNRSNCAFRYGLLRLATKPTAKSVIKENEYEQKIAGYRGFGGKATERNL